MAAVPAHAGALAFGPSLNAGAYRIDNTGDFMPRHARILDARPRSLLGHGITVTDAASFDLDAHRTGAGFGDFAFNNFKGSIRPSDLHNTHLRHNFSDLALIISSILSDRTDG
jgi:hypothetical protein